MGDVSSMTIDSKDTQTWTLYGELHRDGGPALIYPNGSEFWYQHGMIHRDDGPAHIAPDGSQFWYQNNQRNRIDGPAVIYSNGIIRWYIKGELIHTWQRYQELIGITDEELSILILKYGDLE